MKRQGQSLVARLVENVLVARLDAIARKTLAHRQRKTLLKQCVTSVIWGYFTLYFLFLKIPTLQFLTSVIGMSLF
jgi:hypothetical protein